MSEIDPKLAARRQRILDAAREVFSEQGGLGAGLRPIAARAGCTTGAIYAVFSSKEDIYATLLRESLGQLSLAVASAAGREADAATAFRAAGRAFFDYYAERPVESALGLYLFEGDGRKGLGPDLDAELNARLGESLDVFRNCLVRLGADETAAGAGAHALFAALIGALTIQRSRRDRSLGTTAGDVVDAILELHLAAFR